MQGIHGILHHALMVRQRAELRQRLFQQSRCAGRPRTGSSQELLRPRAREGLQQRERELLRPPRHGLFFLPRRLWKSFNGEPRPPAVAASRVSKFLQPPEPDNRRRCVRELGSSVPVSFGEVNFDSSVRVIFRQGRWGPAEACSAAMSAVGDVVDPPQIPYMASLFRRIWADLHSPTAALCSHGYAPASAAAGSQTEEAGDGSGVGTGQIVRILKGSAPEGSTKQGREPQLQQHKRYPKYEQEELPQMVDAIRAMLTPMGDGQISISAYDTAWVALVKRQDGGDGPQFPSSINWIVQNQLKDGSWGDTFFLIHDRIINTIACVVALKSWNIHADKCEKGLSFIRENLWKLVEAEDDQMVCGFEITLPQLLEMATDLGLRVPSSDETSLQDIYAKRDLKLSRIPRDVLHAVPTTLLLSIEGMKGLDWKKILKFQLSDGSIMSSPAPTAYALMETGDAKCFEFLDKVVKIFNGGVPFTYPIDLLERLWAVDRLERLGISRYFTSEIKLALDYVYRHWNEKGIPATRDCPVNDIDDTAMGFRLLRLHGYDVSPCVFNYFEKDGEFIVYPGQSNQSVTAIYNTYRAAQVAFPSEEVLNRADTYCHQFLHDRRSTNKLEDKWVIAKDLAGEVGYALDFPWKASLPRIEARVYLEQYGASSDVWIGKVLYRMPLVSNDLYLQTAKADFNNFQRICRDEWHGLKRWYGRKNLQLFGVTPKSALRAYFLASANIFESERAAERLGWAHTAVLAEAISSQFQRSGWSEKSIQDFISNLASDRYNNVARGAEMTENSLLFAIDELIDFVAFDNVSITHLREAWKQWLTALSAKEGQGSCQGDTALLLVRTIEISSGRHGSSMQKHNLSEYSKLEKLTTSICRKLGAKVLQNEERIEDVEDLGRQIDLEMQELAQLVFQNGSGINRVTKQTFFHVVKSFYYAAHCLPETIDAHISKVLFEDVI